MAFKIYKTKVDKPVVGSIQELNSCLNRIMTRRLSNSEETSDVWIVRKPKGIAEHVAFTLQKKKTA